MSLYQAIHKLLNRKKRHDEKAGIIYSADGLRTNNKNLEALSERKFLYAWNKARIANEKGWPKGVPDIRWRAHIAIWAASNGLNIEGDFVECGVHTGILSLSICHYLDFNELNKKFFLFDTYEGIPIDTLSGPEINRAKYLNEVQYSNSYEIAKTNFNEFPDAILVKGIIPQSLNLVDIKKISYLSIDLNNAVAEICAMEYFWPKLSSSAIVVLDDYAVLQHEPQKLAMDEYAKSVNVSIVSLPTGQGLIIKP